MLFFLFIGIILSVLMLLLLWLRKGKELADYLLLSWMLVITVQMFFFYYMFNGYLYQHPKIIVAFSPIPLLHGPLLYFYTTEVTGRLKATVKKVLPHAIPFIVLSVLATPFFLETPQRQYAIVNGDFTGYHWYMYAKMVFFVVSGLSYAIASIIEVHKYRKRIKNYLSNTDRVQLRWLEFLNMGLGIIWIVVLFWDDFYISSMVTVFVILTALFSINQLPILYSNQLAMVDAEPERSRKDSDRKTTTEKYAKSGLDDQGLQQIIHTVEAFMHSQKAFKNPELTLKELSEQTGVPSHQLSQAINSHHGKSFYHYVNSLRLNEFLEMAQQPESKQYTYLSLAFDAGFNSKTTFNKYFKLSTGQTPTEYFSSQNAA